MASDIGLNLYIIDKPVAEEPEERPPESPRIKPAAAPWKSATEYFDETLVGKPPADPCPGLGDEDQDQLDPTVKGGMAWRLFMQDSKVARWSGFRLFKSLGGSAVTTVYLAEDLELKKKVVLKVLNWSQVPGEYQRSVYSQLMKIYDTIPEHHNIIRPVKRIVDGYNHFLLLDWCRNSSLANALGPKGMFYRGVAENLGRDMTGQICDGLYFLMKNSLPHGRLTLENVLLDADFKVRLCDYGYPPSTCKTDDDFHLRYRPPEYVQGRPHTAYVADIWSLGVVLYALLHGAMPYSVNDIRRAGKVINLPPLDFRASLSLPCTQMVKRLLTYSPLIRPTLAKVMKDTWLTTRPVKKTTMHPSCYEDHDECKPEANANTTGQYLPSTHSSDSPCATCEPHAKAQAQAKAGRPPGAGLAATTEQSPSIPSGYDPIPSPSASPPQRRPKPPTAAGGSADQAAAVSQPTGAAERKEKWPPLFTGGGSITCPNGNTYPLKPLSARAMEMHYNQSIHKHLCWHCYSKMYDVEDVDKPWITESHRGKRMSPRIASMFTHYRAMSPNYILKNPPPGEKQPASSVAVPSVDQIKDQLMDYLKYSERMRAKFYRYHACVIPSSCREYPLPPLVIRSWASKTGQGRTRE